MHQLESTTILDEEKTITILHCIQKEQEIRKRVQNKGHILEEKDENEQVDEWTDRYWTRITEIWKDELTMKIILEA